VVVKFSRQLENQDGAVALMMAAIISLLFIIITLAMIKLMSGELRAASDSENSIQALYAADSAVEDRILAIKNAIATGNLTALNSDCSTPAPAYGLSTSTIACTSFNPTSGTEFKDGFVEQDGSLVYFIPQAAGTFTIDWDEPDGAKTGLFDPAFSTAGTAYSGPSPLSVTIINYPVGNPQGADFRRVDVYPSLSLNTIGAAFNVLANVASGGGYVGAHQCTNNSTLSYRCTVSLVNFKNPGRKSVIRISPRFKGAKIRVTTDSPIFGQTATLDVTARTGASHRRVVEEVNINSAPFTSVGDVIRGDEEVCKQVKQYQAPGFNDVDPTSGCFGGFN
jgi:hypothetical protein